MKTPTGDVDYRLLNALVSWVPLVMVIYEPVLSVLDIAAFATVSFATFYMDIPRSTHLAQAFYTLVAMYDASLSIKVVVYCISVLPALFASANFIEPVGILCRQWWMVRLLWAMWQVSTVSTTEVCIVAACKILSNLDRVLREDGTVRMGHGRFSGLQALKHVDTFIFIVVTRFAVDRRAAYYNVLVYLLLACICGAWASVRRGDQFKALLGVWMILWSDYHIYKTLYFAVCGTLVFCLSRSSDPAVSFKWSRLRGVYSATMITVFCVAYELAGKDGVGAAGVIELLMLLLKIHEERPDVWTGCWTSLVLYGLFPYQLHFWLAVLFTYGDVLEERFLGHQGCGVHLALVGLYSIRSVSLFPLILSWMWVVFGFLLLNLVLGLVSKPDDCFPPELIPYFNKKLAGNAFSFNPLGYFLKPGSPCHSWRRMTWSSIQAQVDSVDFQDFDADLVVGVMSGGAFVEHLVARHHPDAERAIIRSQVWSRLSSLEYLNAISHVFMDMVSWRASHPKALSWILSPPSYNYQRILIVDDAVYTAQTLSNVVDFMTAQFPRAEVRTFVLYAPKKCSGVDQAVDLDYVVNRGPVPLIWPWGVAME